MDDIQEDETQYYTDTFISRQYNHLKPQQKIDILWEALDKMQEYNGRSKLLCVAMALGYDNNEGAYDTYYKRSL